MMIVVYLDGYNYRGKSRGGRPRYSQQQNGNESPNPNTQQNENYSGQSRPRGALGGSGYRGRYRSHNRGGHRPNDRNYQQQQGQDSNLDNSVPSDTTQRSNEGSYNNRRGGGNAVATGNRQQQQPPPPPQQQQQQQSQQEQWDVGNWNGETLIYNRTTKEDESALDAESNSSKTLPDGKKFS